MTIFFIGPVPPPVHGFSVMNLAMLEKLRQHTETVLFNRAPPAQQGRWRKLVGRAWGTASQLWQLHSGLRRAQQRTVYLGLSGGWGQAFDAAFCLVARLAGATVFFHHHSFAYINHPSRLAAGVFACAGARAQHIVLCNCMGEQLAARYGLAPNRVHALSNAALVPPADPSAAPPMALAPTDVPAPATSFAPVIGFLSNITAEKGIFSFFDTLNALRTQGVPHSACIAGPVDPAIRAEFEQRLAATPQARHIGPVYGADKAAFFQGLDLLFFPTQYVNEAEPVTLLEAQQHGVPVVAAARGCIADMVPSHAGAVVPLQDFPLVALHEVRKLLALAPAERGAARAATRQASHTHLQNEQAKLAALLNLMSSPHPLP